MRNKLKTTFAIGLVALIGFLPSEAKPKDDVEKYVVEATHNAGDNVLKVRPFDYTLPAKTQRLDVMIGRRHGSVTLYGYWKHDNKDRSWTGARADYSKKFMDDRLRANIQLRGFLGMNSKSKDEFYFIPTAEYKIGKFGVGVLGYGKKASGKDSFFYLGPSLSAKLTENTKATVSYDWDVLSGSRMLFLKAGVKF